MADEKQAAPPEIQPALDQEKAQAGEILEAQNQTDGKDVAAQFLARLDPAIAVEPVTETEARRVLWKIDLIMIPLIMVTVVLAAIDKVIISNAAIYGMKKDTHLTGDQYSWVGSIFYFGYLAFEYPAALLIQRLPVAKLYVGMVLGWAILLLCTAATQNFAGLATVRFLMGMTEAAVFPISSILTVMWWKTSEQPIRVAFWFNQLSSVFSGVVSYGIGQTNTALAPWRLLFIALGAFSLLWAGVLYIFLPDSPVQCWYFSDREKFVCLERVKDNNTGMEDKTIKWYQVRECLLDPKTWLLALFSLAQNIPNGGLVTFSAIIVTGLGYSPLITTLLGIPTGVLATVWQILLGFIAASVPNSRCNIIAMANLVPMICAILMWKLPRENKHGLLAAYYVFYTYWAPYVLSTSLPMANTSGHSKKLTMNAIFFLAYCIGNIIGPQCFRSGDAPSYSRGYEGLLGCLVVAIVAIISYGVLCRWENNRRDKEAQSNVETLEVLAFSDLTDKEKRSFRYTY
ncbi:Major facilitator superfamily domain general substrate transporter [Penicillium samsonianum]|uniref:Major facilitator superfamily domain general substrate transporter n=1 Tax=Penicillium samsonianum TaxID=1882272 RepID=UPI0025469EF6|nr:Major facilitator superfamily domain general substrate transporter [Penicillium samsonianum]KAJ6124385.1 Major facilitator superfamily domain general substrate transporter [Penicillium samsonianum]